MKRDVNQATKRSLANPSEVEDRIRLRAYELYKKRGGQDGLELDDWLQAEEEVLNSGEVPKAA